MSKHLQRDLDDLQHDLIGLATSVEEAIHKAIRSLRERDAELAEEVIAGDAGIDEGENRVEEECLKILALHQPVAVDLRMITSALKINTDLERMGDLAEDIAERAIQLAQPPFVPIPEKLQRMTDLTAMMVRESINAFTNLEATEARRICRMDDEVDQLNHEIIDELVRTMQADPALVAPGLSLFSATRHLERIADHATNIAEDVVYLVEGEIIRHRPVTVPAEG